MISTGDKSKSPSSDNFSMLRDTRKSHIKPTFIPVDPQISANVNCEYIKSDLLVYPYKVTPHGDVYYSPRYYDSRYVYRHVILSNGVKKAAETLAKNSPSGLLNEEQFIHQLGIDLSPGWEHFMRFKGKLRELILRRPLPEDVDHTGAPANADEQTDLSDNSDIEDGQEIQSHALMNKAEKLQIQPNGIC